MFRQLLSMFAHRAIIAVLILLAVPGAPGRPDRASAQPYGVPFQTYPMYSSAAAVTMADLNGDGGLDVSVGVEEGRISTLQGNGAGGFNARIDFVTGAAPTAMAAADLSGDGVLDLITLNFTTNTLRVHRGVRGAVSYDAIFDIAAGAGPSDLAVGDLNHDGHPDVVVACFNNATIRVLLGNGDGTFTIGGQYPMGGQPQGIALGDLDLDGHLDVAVASGVGFFWRFGDGSGGFGVQIKKLGGTVTDIGFLYANGDSLPDLVTTFALGGSTGEISTWYGTGGGAITAGTSTFLPTLAPTKLILGSFDPSSASTDIAVIGSGSIGAVLTGSTSGFVAPAKLFRAGNAMVDFAAGDLDRDGDLDLAVASSPHNVSLLFGDGTGAFGVTRIIPITDTQPSQVVLADMNGDLVNDFVSSSVDTITVALGNGSGGATTISSTFVPLINPRALAVADFNADGDLDVASAGANPNVGLPGLVSPFANNGAGALSAGATVEVGSVPVNLVAGDLNHDTLPDLITAQPDSGILSILLNTGTGFTLAGTTLGGYPYDLAVGDLNGDTHPDVCAADSISNGVWIHYGDGAGALGAGTFLATATGPTSLVITDYDQDGNPDILAACSSAGAVSVLRNLGAGAWEAAVNVSVPGSPRDLTAYSTTSMGVAFSAVYVTTFNDNTVQILGSSFGNPFYVNNVGWGVGAGAYGIARGPIDGDGVVDLVVANSVDGNLQVLLAELPGPPPPDSPPVVTAPASANVEAGGTLTFTVAAGDVDGDPIGSLIASDLPTGAVFTPNGQNTQGTLVWSPTAAQIGDHVVTFTGTNALVGMATAVIRVVPTDTDAAAAFLWQPEAGDEGTHQICFTASGYPGELPTTVCTTVTVTGSSVVAGGGDAAVAGGSAQAALAPATPNKTTKGPVISVKGFTSVAIGETLALDVSATNTDTLQVDTTDLPAENTATFAPDQSPTLAAPQQVDATPGSPLVIGVSAADPDGDQLLSLSADLSTLPPGNDATFVPNGDNTGGTLTWTPAVTDSGNFGVTFTARNVLVGVANTVIRVGTGLVGYWKLNQNGLDWTGHANMWPNGTAAYASGPLNQALTVSGVLLDGLLAVATSEHDLPIGQPWTIECWFRVGVLNAAAENPIVVAVGSQHWMLSVSTGGQARFIANDGIATTTLASLGVVADGAWHHAAVASDGSTATLYVDGSPQASDVVPASITVAGGLLTLGYDPVDGAGLDGGVDEVRIWRRERSQAEIQAAMNQELSGYATAVLTPAPVYRNALHQNTPNPFNPRTEIVFELARAGRVSVRVYDVAGRLVRTLVDGALGAGPHRATWDGVDRSGRTVASGAYFYRLAAPGFRETRRMLLLK